MTEDEMVGWSHQLDGHEFEQALGAGNGQGSLVCCSPWCCKEWDMTEQLNRTACPVALPFKHMCRMHRAFTNFTLHLYHI